MAQIAIPQNHVSKYLDRMELGLEDKLWFIDNPLLKNVNVFLDYGCADGVLAEAILNLKENSIVICFDEDDAFLQIAERRLEYYEDRFVLCRSLQEAQETMFHLKSEGHKTATILSSVLHEVQSFINAKEWEGSWEKEISDLCNGCSDFLVIRDMGCESDSYRTKVAKEDYQKVQAISDDLQLQEFELAWGETDIQSCFIHWLLKYHYTDNWEREMTENYMVCIDTLVEDIECRDYVCAYEEYYTHPWIKQQVLKDFDIQLVDPTHFKIIMQKVDENEYED